MLNVRKLFKNYAETGSFNEKINLHGFIDDNVFLTKTGELGGVLEVRGVDCECLDGNTIDTLTKRLESAFKLFDEKFRLYQYVFRHDNPTIPYKLYGNPVVDTAIRNRIEYLEAKAHTLFSLSIYYVVLFEGCRPQSNLTATLLQFPHDPRRTARVLLSSLSPAKEVLLLDREITRAQANLHQKLSSFALQVSDFLSVRLLAKDDAFRVIYKTLNFDPLKVGLSHLRSDTFLDCQLCDSLLECHRPYLRLDDYYVRVLTLKEPSAQSFPLIFKRLLEVQANYFVVTEWKKEDSGKARSVIQAKRRHFHNSKRSFMSQVNLSDSPVQDTLLDDSKESQVRELGESIKELEIKGNYFGQFSLTIVVYDLDESKVERTCAEFYKVFSVYDAALNDEKYNRLNAYLATVPGNYPLNLRYSYLLNTNHADYSFLFFPDRGEARNTHLRQEYLAVLETNHCTPYFLNLHYYDTAHSMILGRTGSGKSFTLNFLITNLQKYDPYVFLFELGVSFESLTRLFGGSYVKIGQNGTEFKINPFCLPNTKPNLDFLTLFVQVLAESHGERLSLEEDQELYHQIENLYGVSPELRTLGVLTNTLPRSLSLKLQKWTSGGQFGFLFDNAEDTVSFSKFQCFNFLGMREYPQILEPLLFYILHRASHVITNPDISDTFKAFFIDEAWTFFRNPRIRGYIVEALKTWRVQNAAMILSTQSLDEMRKSGIVDVIIETCATKIFLANPDMDHKLYQDQFHLNETEIDLIANLIPKQQFLIRTPDRAKVANLHVDPKSYWLYTSDPYDNKRRREAFQQHGFAKGLEVLAATNHTKADGDLQPDRATSPNTSRRTKSHSGDQQ